MTEETSLDAKINHLQKKLEDQARFTRTVVVVCTTAILAVLFYMLTEIFGSLPTLIVANYMANLDKIVMQWKATENSLIKKPAETKPEPASETPAAGK